MAIVLTNIGTANEGSESGSSLSISVPAGGVPAGSLIVVIVQESGAPSGIGSLGAVSDTAINSYSAAASTKKNSNGDWIAIFFASNVAAMVSGNTIKYTFSHSGNDCSMSAFYATGVKKTSPLDSAVTVTLANQTSGSGGSTTALVSGAPSVSGELIVAGIGWGDTSTPSYTQSGGGFATPFTEVSFHDSTLGFFGAVGGGTLIKSGIGTTSFQPTIRASSNTYASIIVGFKPAAAAFAYSTVIF